MKIDHSKRVIKVYVHLECFVIGQTHFIIYNFTRQQVKIIHHKISIFFCNTYKVLKQFVKHILKTICENSKFVLFQAFECS